MNDPVKANTLKRAVSRTFRSGRAKMNTVLQAFRRTDMKTIPPSGKKPYLSIIPQDSSSKPHLFEDAKTEVNTSPSSRCSTPSPSRRYSLDKDSGLVHGVKLSGLPRLKRIVGEHVSHPRDAIPKDQIDHKEDAATDLINRLRAHQIEWAAMIELEKSDPTGTLRGMSARQIRRLVQQKRSETWLTETYGPLYESDEDCFSDDDMTRRGSEGSSLTHYHQALEPSEDEDWSRCF